MFMFLWCGALSAANGGWPAGLGGPTSVLAHGRLLQHPRWPRLSLLRSLCPPLHFLFPSRKSPLLSFYLFSNSIQSNLYLLSLTHIHNHQLTDILIMSWHKKVYYYTASTVTLLNMNALLFWTNFGKWQQGGTTLIMRELELGMGMRMRMRRTMIDLIWSL